MPTCDECGEEFDSERGMHVHEAQVHGGSSSGEGSSSGSEGAFSFELKAAHALLLAFIIGVLAGGFFMSAIGATGAFGTVQDGTNPEAAQENQEADGEQAAPDNPRTQISEDFIAGEASLGDSNAPVTVIELSDFGCPWCAEWAGFDAIPQRPIDEEDSLNKIKTNYVESGDVRFVFKDHPVEQLHPNAVQAHVAANCVLDQSEDLYWEFHDGLFENRGQWTAGGENQPDETFRQIAQDIGADADTMASCVSSSDGSDVQQDLQEVQDQVGSIGTPTFLIGSFEDGFVEVEGAQPYSSLKTIIDSELDG